MSFSSPSSLSSCSASVRFERAIFTKGRNANRFAIKTGSILSIHLTARMETKMKYTTEGGMRIATSDDIHKYCNITPRVLYSIKKNHIWSGRVL